MPRVARTPASRSHTLPTGGKTPPFPPLPIRCSEPGCPWSFARKGCLKRHSAKHMSPEEREKQMIHCSEPGCTHKTMQQSNMNTHYTARHTGLKPHMCAECAYCAADPSCLYRHMLALHPASDGVTSTSRSRKAKNLTPPATSPDAVEPASPSAFLDYLDAARSAWTTPSPSSSTVSLPFSLGYPSSPSHDDQLTPDAWTTPSPSSSTESLPSPPDPSADELFVPDGHFYPDASSPSSSESLSNAELAWMWSPDFRDACAAVGIVAPIPLPDPALHQPAENVASFVLADDPSLFFPEPEPGHSYTQPLPLFVYDSASCALEHSASYTRQSSFGFNPQPFLGEWSHDIY
ncbi:hypothetical protein FB451DRAFT_162910 [Mycena latifolia]|nr:hypothetical protein FB451DRAFT_162910 [Mycena latifolia]